MSPTSKAISSPVGAGSVGPGDAEEASATHLASGIAVAVRHPGGLNSRGVRAGRGVLRGGRRRRRDPTGRRRLNRGGRLASSGGALGGRARHLVQVRPSSRRGRALIARLPAGGTLVPCSRDELEGAARDLVAGLEKCTRKAVPGGRPGQRSGHEPLRPDRVEKHDRPPVGGQHRTHGCEATRKSVRLPSPINPGRRSREFLERQARRRKTPEDRARGVVGEGQRVAGPAQRGLRQRQPDAAVAHPVESQPALLAGAREAPADDRVRGPVHEVEGILAEPGQHGPARRRLELLHEASNEAAPLLEQEPGVPLTPLAMSRRSEMPAGDPERADAAGKAVEAAGGEQDVEEREAQRCLDRRRPQVRIEAVNNRLDRRQRARRVQPQDLVRECIDAGDDRESRPQRKPRRLAAGDLDRTLRIRGIRGGHAGFATAELVPAGQAAVELAERDDPVRLPDELIHDRRAPARGATRREEVAQRLPEAGLPQGRIGERRESRVEMADIRRPQHDLGEEPRERRRLERERASLTAHRRPRDPGSTAEQIDDDVPGTRPGLDLRGDPVERRRRGEAVEVGQDRTLFRSDERGERLGHRLAV